MNKRLILLATMLPLSGCGLMIQRNPESDQIIPAYWIERDYASPADIGPNNGDITTFVGRVAYKGADSRWHFLGNPVFKNTPKITVVTDPTTYFFHTIIDAKYSTNTSVPALTLSGDANSAYDYQIRDVAHTRIDPANIPDRRTVQAAYKTATGSPATGKAIYWIQAVGLTTVSYKVASAIGSNGTITGTGFNTGLSTFNSSSSEQFFPLVSLAAEPMTPEADAEVNAKPAPPQPVLTAPTAELMARPHIPATLSGALSSVIVLPGQTTPATDRPRWSARLTRGASNGDYVKYVFDH